MAGTPIKEAYFETADLTEFDAIAGGASASTIIDAGTDPGLVLQGNYAWRSGVTKMVGFVLGGLPVLYMRMGLYIEAFPSSGNIAIFRFGGVQTGFGSRPAGLLMTSAGNIQAFYGSGALLETGNVTAVSIDTHYVVEAFLNASAQQVQWRLDGVAQSTLNASSGGGNLYGPQWFGVQAGTSGGVFGSPSIILDAIALATDDWIGGIKLAKGAPPNVNVVQI